MSTPEVRAGHVAIAGAAIAGTVLGVVALVLLWLHARHLPPGGMPLEPAYSSTVPGPRLQSAPQPDLRADRLRKEARLHGSGWVDASRGIVHIPVETAMALMAARSASAASGAGSEGGTR